MNLLSIGGSDPSSGAGIQRDIMTFSELGAHGLAVVTAVTSQNTSSFLSAFPLPARVVEEQIRAAVSDFEVDGIKIGMVYDTDIIGVVCGFLEGVDVPVAVDPVIRSTTGGTLLADSAIDDLRGMIRFATIATPNLDEAKILARTDGGPEEAARAIMGMGAGSVAVTGIVSGKTVSDLIVERDASCMLSSPADDSANHGGGCSYSAAMLVALTRGYGIRRSAEVAREFARTVRGGPRIGSGSYPIHLIGQDGIGMALSSAIGRFVRMDGIHRHIPQCQTNFVYSKENPRSVREVMGLSGRIVRAGNAAIVAGSLEYGGSKHVATAVCAACRTFPAIRSAVNMRYDDAVIGRAADAGMAVAEYDRAEEPKRIRASGSSIEWGVGRAAAQSARPPDVVFHRGGYGKEPMMIIFGTDPEDVLQKVASLYAV